MFACFTFFFEEGMKKEAMKEDGGLGDSFWSENMHLDPIGEVVIFLVIFQQQKKNQNQKIKIKKSKKT